MAQPSLIVLDLDDTLIDYTASHAQARSAMLERGVRLLRVPRRELEEAVDEGRRLIKEQVGPTAASHNRLLYLQRGLEVLGLGVQVEAAVALERVYWRHLLMASRVFPGVETFLSSARTNGATLALVTDLTAEAQFEKLLYFRLDRHLDILVTSEEAGGDKITGRPLELLRRKLPAGALDGPVWSIGDAEHDLVGPKKELGAVTFQRLLQPWTSRHPAADVAFLDFRELEDRLATATSSTSRSEALEIGPGEPAR